MEHPDCLDNPCERLIVIRRGAALKSAQPYARPEKVLDVLRGSYRTVFLRAARPYLALSAVWILGSDWLIGISGLSPEGRLAAQSSKGLAFVIISALYMTAVAGRLLERANRSEILSASQLTNRAALFESLPGPLFVLDARGKVTFWNRRFHAMMGLSPEEIQGQPAEFVLAEADHARVRAALETCLATGTPQTVEARLVMPDGATVSYLWSGAPVFDGNGGISGIVGFGLDHSQEERARELLRGHLRKIESVLTQTVLAIGIAMEARDAYTAGHQQKVSQLAVAVALRLGIDGERLKGLALAAQVHDIGKLGVPGDLLTMPRRLTEPEMAVVREHVEWGYRILRDIEFPWPVATMVRQHHERLDGSGYPLGLKGDAILLESRVLAVADVVEAITSHRPYRAALGLDVAIEELEQGLGTIYDREVVAACREVIDGGFAFETPKSLAR